MLFKLSLRQANGRRNYRTVLLNSDFFSLVYKYGSFKPVKRVRYDFLQFSFIIILFNRTFLLSKKNRKLCYKDFRSALNMVFPRRFERPTPALGGRCSIQLSYGNKTYAGA